MADRGFRLLWVGETFSKFGTAITGVALPLVAVGVLDASPLQIGLITAAQWLPWLLGGLPAGVWVDRLPTRPLMIVCNLVSMVAIGSVPLAAAFGALHVVHLLVAAFVAGVAGVFFSTAYVVLVPSLVPARSLAGANAALQGSESAAQVAIVPVVGLIVYNVVVTTFRHRFTPDGLLGRVTATMRFVLFGTIPLGGVLGGLFGSAVGVRAALWWLLAAGVVPGLLVVLSPIRTMRELPASPVSG